jgi:hypothetical protein
LFIVAILIHDTEQFKIFSLPLSDNLEEINGIFPKHGDHNGSEGKRDPSEDVSETTHILSQFTVSFIVLIWVVQDEQMDEIKDHSQSHENNEASEQLALDVLGALNSIDTKSAYSNRHGLGAVVHREDGDDRVDEQDNLGDQ